MFMTGSPRATTTYKNLSLLRGEDDSLLAHGVILLAHHRPILEHNWQPKLSQGLDHGVLEGEGSSLDLIVLRRFHSTFGEVTLLVLVKEAV